MTTVTALQLKSTFYGFMDGLYPGVATGGSTSTLTDTGLIGYLSETWPTKIEGQQIRITSGLAAGDVRLVGRFDRSEGTIYPSRNFSAAVANTDTYELWATSINGGTPLTTLMNDVLRDLRPVTDTQVTVVTQQNQYTLTTVAQTRRDIHEVYIRMLDPAGLAPYRVITLVPGLQWTAYDRGGGGTTSVTLELKASRTLQPTIEELWVRAATTITPIATDASTVDAVYRDWIAWECVLEHCLRRLTLNSGDAARWNALKTRAMEHVASWRQRWIPREPVVISVEF